MNIKIYSASTLRRSFRLNRSESLDLEQPFKSGKRGGGKLFQFSSLSVYTAYVREWQILDIKVNGKKLQFERERDSTGSGKFSPILAEILPELEARHF